MRYSTLHEAIVFLLKGNKTLSFSEIARFIQEGDLWRRPSDGKFPQIKQIKDRTLYKYSNLFIKIGNDKLKLKGQLAYPQKISRLTYNNIGWVEPSGRDRKSKTKGLHEAQHGFGHEEWLFDFSKLINGYKYGFIEGFRTKNNKHAGNAYNLQLFTIDHLLKEKYWVATIQNCYVLTSDEELEIQETYFNKGWIKEQEIQLRKLNLWNQGSSNSLQSFGPNVRFLEKDVLIFEEPVPVTHNTFIDSRDRYLIYDWEDSCSIVDNIKGFVFKPSKPNENKKVWRKNAPEFKSKEIKQLHRQISQRLFKELSELFGEQNIGCDVPNSSGTYIDMVRKSGDKYILYEIKTYNQLRKNIREALGQLLEYAYWDCSKKIKEIVIVSDKNIEKTANEYLQYLNKFFKMPISYKCKKIDNE